MLAFDLHKNAVLERHIFFAKISYWTCFINSPLKASYMNVTIEN